MSDKPIDPKDDRYVRPLSAESSGSAPGRGRLKGRRILVVGGGQRIFDSETDPIGNGRAMSILFAREGAHVAVADVNRSSAEDAALKAGSQMAVYERLLESGARRSDAQHRPSRSAARDTG